MAYLQTMRTLRAVLVLLLVGCGDDVMAAADGGLDAQVADAGLDAFVPDAFVPIDAFVPPDAGELDAGQDAGTDAGQDAATCPTMLLEGGTDLELQGWSTVMQGPATLTYGATFVQLETTTTSGASSGGQLLVTLPDAVEPPFRLEVVMQVEAVNAHNPFDSAAAILGSFTPPFGVGNERAQMIYVDANAVGWADDSASAALTTTDDGYHTYVLSVDESGNAQLSVDGTQALTRAGYTTNGTIAIGDQTNDANVDSTLRIRSVRLLCP
jgi:hypothetical protein